MTILIGNSNYFCKDLSCSTTPLTTLVFFVTRGRPSTSSPSNIFTAFSPPSEKTLYSMLREMSAFAILASKLTFREKGCFLLHCGLSRTIVGKLLLLSSWVFLTLSTIYLKFFINYCLVMVRKISAVCKTPKSGLLVGA